MRVQFAPGAMFKVPAGEDDFAYSVMLATFPYVAFYRKDVIFNESGAPVGEPMFVIQVAKVAYSSGGWGRPIRQLSESEIPPIPRFFWQSPVKKYDCKIIEPNQRKISCSPTECVGLEPAAAWSTEHIESRIQDTYAGRANVFLESLQPRL